MTYFSGLPLAGADKFSQQLNRLLTIPAINVSRETTPTFHTRQTFHVKHGEAFKRQETQPKPKTTKTHTPHPSK
jgi:hypothetical protein